MIITKLVTNFDDTLKKGRNIYRIEFERSGPMILKLYEIKIKKLYDRRASSQPKKERDWWASMANDIHVESSTYRIISVVFLVILLIPIESF
jgi:hypothetical protein